MAKADITTIKLNKKTKQRLDKLRLHDRESYDKIVQRMLGILNICRTDSDTAQEKLEDLEKQIQRNKLSQRSISL